MTKEESRTYDKAYYEAHKEERKAYQKVYNETHKEEKRTRDKAYYKSHKEEKKAYYEAHKGETKLYNRKRVFNYLSSKYDWSQVEGFDGWKEHTDVHHRWEDLGYSRKRLIQMDHYYNCEPWELICMSRSEHIHHHHTLKHK